MNFKSEVYNLHKYLSFSNKELRNLAIVIFSFAFIYSFDNWGDKVFNLAVGLKNLFFAIILVGSVILMHHLSQKVYAVHKGFLIEQTIWWPGIVVGLFVAIMTSGQIGVYAATAFHITKLTKSRLGRFRYHPEVKALGNTAMWGMLGVTFFGGLFKTLELWLGISFPFTNAVFNFSMLFAVYNFLPIPPLDGIKIFFQSRLIYVYFFGTIFSYILLINLGEIYSYFWSILVGVIFVVLFYYFFERHW